MVTKIYFYSFIFDKFSFYVHFVFNNESFFRFWALWFLEIFLFNQLSKFNTLKAIFSSNLIFTCSYSHAFDKSIELYLIWIIDILYVDIAFKHFFLIFRYGGWLNIVFKERMQGNWVSNDVFLVKSVNNAMLIHTG